MPQTKTKQEDIGRYLGAVVQRGRTMLLPVLIEAQNISGYISKETAAEVGKALGAPLAEVSGVIEFYSMLHDAPTGDTFIRVCTSPTCAVKGGLSLLDDICDQINTSPGKPTGDGKYFVEAAACLGLCDRAPAVLVGEKGVGNATVKRVFNPIDNPVSSIYGPNRLLTRRCGEVDPVSLDDYLAEDGFRGLKQALSMTPKAVIESVKESGLVGRGGAGFPTGIKWEGAAQAEGSPKYMVCNADESEPGTFKDRALLTGDPFSILEGMLIGAYATGAEKGLMYIRGEYPEAQEIFMDVIETAGKEGYLGKNVLGKNFNFEVELRSGAGAYICGEETALFESIEGKRGFPRIKPPFPTTHGLFGKPTAINNVETFANVPLLMRIGVDGYRKYGSEAAPGPRLFCVSGDVGKPGIYEITGEVTLRELVYDQAGGIPGGGGMKAALLGGAAGKFVSPDNLDIPLTVEGTREAGLSLGSGAVMVFDESQDLKRVLASLGEFFAHESCGKCYPCQLGTQRQAEMLERNQAGKALPGDVERLQDVGWTMTEASLCGLGQTAALAVLSAMDLWPELFEGGV